MKMKKFLSLILTLCMLIQVLPVFATDYADTAVNSGEVQYIVNEDFGLDDLGGFTLNSTSAGSVDSVEIAEDPGNYALEFSSGNRYWVDGEYALLNVDDAEFVDGAELVVKTRIKLVGSGDSTRSPRAVFKYNKESGVTDATENTGLFFTVGPDGISGWAYNAAGTSLGVRTLTTTSTSFENVWFNAEIRIKDAENATMEIYDDNGGTTGIIPFYLTGGITTGIENIYIRSDKEDEVYIDFLQIYYESEAEMLVDSEYAADEAVTVTFDTEAGNETFKDAVAIYDNTGKKVETQNTIDETNKIVTLIPIDSFTNGMMYTVRLDKTKVSGNYKISETAKQFFVSDIDYIVNEQFKADDLGGFALNSASAGTLGSAEIQENIGNYALDFSAGGRYWADSEYALLNVDDADFVNGADLVVKTRIKLIGSGDSTRSPRAVFKYNKESGVTDATENTGLFFTVGPDGISGWAYNTAGTSLGVRTLTTTSASFEDVWFNAEIRIKDAENATMEIYDDNGGTTGIIPFYLTGGITTGIENIYIRSDKEDKVYLDYVQIFYEYETKMNVNSRYGKNEPITVTFDTAVGNEAFKDAVAIYDNAGKKVITDNSIDETNKIVTLTPVDSLINDAKYTVRFDKEGISGNYVIDETTKIFTVSDVDYILNEQFGLNDLGGFTLNSASTGNVNSVEITEDPGNYAFVFSAGGRYWADSEYAVLNVDGADFNGEENLVIKTRIKLEGSGDSTRSPRAVFKYNKVPGVTDATENTGLFFTVGTDGLSTWAYNATGTSLGVRTLTTTSTSFENVWFNAEIRIKDKDTATMIITDDNGGTTGVIPFYLTGDITTGIENIYVRSDKEDKVYIDYIQIYKTTTYDATATVAQKVLNTASINVVFESANEIDSIPVGAVTLTDKSGKTVSATQNYVATTKTLTITPDDDLKVGSTYKVSIDSSVLGEVFMNYTGETEFEVFVTGENGLVYSEHFDDGTGEWVSAGVSDNGTIINNRLVFNTTAPEGETASVMHFGATQVTGWPNTARPNAYYNLENPITFEEGKNVVVKTRIMHVPGTGNATYTSATLKLNRPLDISAYTPLEVANHPYSVVSLYPERIQVYAGGSKTTLATVTEDMSNKWVDVELVFDGKAEERTIKLSDGTSKTYTSREGYTISVKTDTMDGAVIARSSLANTDTESYMLAGLDPSADDFAGYTALETINFVLNVQPDDLYVDYVEIYEIEASELEATDVYAKMPAGNTVKYNEAIQLKFYDVNPLVLFPTNAVTLKSASGAIIEATNTYNKSTGILSVKPASDLTKGDYYSINITPSILGESGINYVGSTYFTVTARDDFETGRVILNDDFNDNTTQGWAPGAATAGYEATVTAENGLLHVVSPKNMGYPAGAQSTVTKLLGDGIELTEGKNIVIKTKVKNVAEGGAYQLSLNKPEDLNNIGANVSIWSIYSLFTNSEDGILVPSNKRGSLQGETGNYVFAYGLGEKTFDEEGDVSGAAPLDTLNKWVEYTITITDEEINNLHIKAEILDDDGNVTATYETDEYNNATIKTGFDAFERVFGKVPGYTTVDDYADPEKFTVMDNMYHKWLSADRLTFMSAKQGAATDFYIDYITVEQLDTREVETSAFAELKVNGTASSVIAAGDSVVPVFTLQGNLGTKFTVISAIYVDGVLDDTHIETLTAENTDEFTYTEPVGYTVPATGKVEIKAFVWNGLDGLKPISAVTKASND